MTTLAFTQHYSPQSLSWDGAAALVAVLQALFVMALVAGLGAVLLGILAAVTAIPSNFWLGLALTGVFALVTYPRSKAVRA